MIRLDENKVVRLEGNPIEGPKSASEYVFTYKGKRVKNIKKAFKTALKNAGITDFRFHDLGHTFASQVVMRGGDLKDVQELLGAQVHVNDTEVFPPVTEAQKKGGQPVKWDNRFVTKSSRCHK